MGDEESVEGGGGCLGGLRELGIAWLWLSWNRGMGRGALGGADLVAMVWEVSLYELGFVHGYVRVSIPGVGVQVQK